MLVSELTDYIRQGFEVSGEEILDHVVTKHRLQAFSPGYFKKDSKLFSYSTENFEASRRAVQTREDPEPFISKGISEPGEEWKTIDLDQLSSFYANPAKFLLNKRLKIFLDERSVILDENEPFDLKGLERYDVEQYLVEKGLEKCSTRDCLPVVKALGQLPQGTPGECLYHDLCNGVEAFVRRLLPYLEQESLKPIEVDLSLAGFRLKGRIENVFADGLLHYRYANPKVKDRMRLWIYHLLLNLLSVEDYPCHGTLLCKDAEFNYPPVEGSEKILERLLKNSGTGFVRSFGKHSKLLTPSRARNCSSMASSKESLTQRLRFSSFGKPFMTSTKPPSSRSMGSARGCFMRMPLRAGASLTPS